MELATRARLNELRQKHLSGTQLSISELQEAIKLMREGRVAAQGTSTASKARKAAKEKLVNLDAGDLLAGLGGFGDGPVAKELKEVTARAGVQDFVASLPSGFRKL